MPRYGGLLRISPRPGTGTAYVHPDYTRPSPTSANPPLGRHGQSTF